MSKDIAKALPFTGMDAALLNPVFTEITAPGGLAEPCFFLKVVNDSNVFVAISYDGTTFHDYIRAGGTMEIYAQTNNQPGNRRAQFPRGLKVYAGSNNPGVGSVNLIAYYQPL